MTRRIRSLALLPFGVWLASGCDSKQETVNQGREAVKDVVAQPFNALNSAKESLRQNEDEQKAALNEAEKELK